MKQISKTEEKAFNRIVVVYETEKVSTTPSRTELQKSIAAKEKAKPELVVVNNVESVYGANKFVVTATVYTNADDFKRVVPNYLKKKSEIKEEKPAEKENDSEKAATE